MREEEKEMYKCQSYYDDDNILQDCTCGKCGEESWEKEYNRKYAPLMAKIDEYYWQKGYPKLENDLRKFISQALSSQLKEVLESLKIYENKLVTLYDKKLPFVLLGQKSTDEEAQRFFIKGFEEATKIVKAEVEKLV